VASSPTILKKFGTFWQRYAPMHLDKMFSEDMHHCIWTKCSAHISTDNGLVRCAGAGGCCWGGVREKHCWLAGG